MYKQTCLFVVNITLHAKAKHNGNARKLVGMYVQITFLSASWIIHKCSEVSVKCHYEARWQDFFSYQFSQFPLESVWLALLCLGNDVNTIQRLLLGSTKHYTSYINNVFFFLIFLFHLTIGFFGSIYFFFKIRWPEPDKINLHLHSIGQPIKNIRIQTIFLLYRCQITSKPKFINCVSDIC